MFGWCHTSHPNSKTTNACIQKELHTINSPPSPMSVYSKFCPLDVLGRIFFAFAPKSRGYWTQKRTDWNALGEVTCTTWNQNRNRQIQINSNPYLLSCFLVTIQCPCCSWNLTSWSNQSFHLRSFLSALLAVIELAGPSSSTEPFRTRLQIPLGYEIEKELAPCWKCWERKYKKEILQRP